MLKQVYGYAFSLKRVNTSEAIESFDGSTIFISDKTEIADIDLNTNIDFYINVHAQLGSILLVNGEQNEKYISEIQHVRRRETIAMTPANSLAALEFLIEPTSFDANKNKKETFN